MSDIISHSPEWRLLLECVSPFPDKAAVSQLLSSCDGPRIVALAQDHGVVGHLALALREFGEALPPATKQMLMECQRGQVCFSLRLTSELFRLLDQFTAAGIEALSVKGPVLSVRAYGDPARRTYGDLDLLVRQRDIHRATELMIAAGYDVQVPLAAIDAGKIPGQYLFHKPHSSLLVELHNDLTLRYFPRRLPLEKLFARQTRVSLDGHCAPALSDEDELVLICVHGAKHFWERLLWIADVAAMVSQHPGTDWNRALEFASDAGAQRMLDTGLQLAAGLLRARLPDEVYARAMSDKTAARLVRSVLEWLPSGGQTTSSLFERASFRLRMRGDWLAAPTYLLRLAFSPTEEDWNVADGSSRSGFLGSLRRPLRLARKYGRRGRS